MKRGIQEVFLEKFGDVPQQVRFNSYSIRMFWENLWTVIKSNPVRGSSELIWPKLPTQRRQPMRDIFQKWKPRGARKNFINLLRMSSEPKRRSRFEQESGSTSGRGRVGPRLASHLSRSHLQEVVRLLLQLEHILGLAAGVHEFNF